MSDKPARKKSALPVIILLLAALAGGAYYMTRVRGLESTDAAQIEGDIIPVSAKVGGHVIELKVDDNQPVKAGDLLLTIDPTDYQIAGDRAAAELAAAQAGYEQAMQTLAVTKVSAPSSLDAAQAALTSARADYDRATKDAVRNRQLKNIATSRRVVEESDAEEQMAKARVAQAEAALKRAETSNDEIAGAEAGVRKLQADLEEKKAAVARAHQDLLNTKVTAPVDGKIAHRAIAAGELVQPNQTLLAVTAARLWVVANFKETQLTHMRPGQTVDIKVDAFSDRKLKGHVDSIQAGTGSRLSLFPPENATGNFVKVVQRVPVKIALDAQPDAALPLAPGMSVEATVHVNDAPRP